MNNVITINNKKDLINLIDTMLKNDYEISIQGSVYDEDGNKHEDIAFYTVSYTRP